MKDVSVGLSENTLFREKKMNLMSNLCILKFIDFHCERSFKNCFYYSSCPVSLVE